MQLNENVLFPFGTQSQHRRPCVLFVEDDLGVQNVVTSVFRYMDFEVKLCSSAEEAAGALEGSKQLDLVVGDICVSRGNVCEMIRGICGAFPRAVVLFCSGHLEEECQLRFLECHDSCPIAFLRKPFHCVTFSKLFVLCC